MDITPGSIQKIGWREDGTAGSFIEAGAALLGIPSIEIGDDEVETALYQSRAAGARKTISIPVHDWSLFAALNTLQLARKRLEIQVTLTDGKVLTYAPVGFTVTPELGRIPHIGEVFVADDGTTSTPASTPGDWTSVGSVQAGSSLEIEAIANQDGYQMPFYKHMKMRHELELFGDSSTDPETTLGPYENLPCTVALLHPDDTYTIYKNVYSEVRVNPDFSEEGFVTNRWRLDGSQANIDNLITFAATPPDYVFGFIINGAAFGYTESNILTVS